MVEPSTPAPGLQIGHVRGVTLTKWQRVWGDRFAEPLQVREVPDAAQLDGLRDGTLDMAFVRLPVEREGLHVIVLYEEQVVAWVSKEHPLAAAGEVTLGDLAGETVLTEVDAVAVDRVLGGAVLVVPMSIARGASRRDLTYSPVVDAEPAPVGLAWRADDENPLLDEFVGVVRGRTLNSSRTAKERGTPVLPPAAKVVRTRAPRTTRNKRRGR